MQVANANAERASEDALKKLADQVEERLVKGYKPVAEPLLPRQALMLRNKELWDLSASPRETPLKPGQWKKLIAQAVIDRRRGRIPGPSSMPMYGTTPLILAVRLGRVACVRELLQHAVFTLNKADGHGMTPLSYAMLALARDKANVVFQQLADMLLAALPNVNATAGVTNPAVLATLMQDQSRLAHMVLRCDTPISRWDNEALVAEYNKTKKMPKSFKAFQRSNVHQINVSGRVYYLVYYRRPPATALSISTRPCWMHVTCYLLFVMTVSLPDAND